MRCLVLTIVGILFLTTTPVRADDTKAPDGLIQVFSGEKDACSKKNDVTIPGKNGRVTVKAGETKYIEMESLKSTFYWRCGDTEEKFEYKDVQPFNWIKVERSADTGRISWTCYVKK
jgi:hypothetical protein